MERQHIIKEIHKLTERIKTNASTDVNLLLNDVAHLYEMVILLKHLPVRQDGRTPSSSGEEVKTNGQSNLVISEVLPVQKEETKSPEKQQVAMDLFSAEQTNTMISPEPVKEKPVAKPAQKKSDESVAEKLQHKKIADLKSVIGINEKFQFINELFEGSMNEYNVALDQINNFSSLNEAITYLANLKEVYKWNSENPIAINFQELVERRFA